MPLDSASPYLWIYLTEKNGVQRYKYKCCSQQHTASKRTNKKQYNYLSGNNGLLNKLLYIHSHWNTMLLLKNIIYIDMERVPWLKITKSKTVFLVWLYLMKSFISLYLPGGGIRSLFIKMVPIDSEWRDFSQRGYTFIVWTAWTSIWSLYKHTE